MGRLRSASLPALLLVSFWLQSVAGQALAQSGPGLRPFRYDEDYSSFADPARRSVLLAPLKYIGLGDNAYLSLGAELRERFEMIDNPGFAAGLPAGAPTDNHYLLQRLLLHGDLHLGEHLRAFVQLGRFDAFDARHGSVGATQQNRGDLVQGFVDVSVAAGEGGRLTLRGGRQEMGFGSGRLISERDGPNLRRAFDGGRAMLTLPDGKLDLFLLRPVRPLGGSFDDSSNDQEAFWGSYATLPLMPGLSLDAYYLGYERAGARFAQGTGFEQRHTVGSRLAGRGGGWDWDLEAAYQFGAFGTAKIQAWTAASDIGFTLAALPWKPRLGVKANIASGDADPHDGKLGTFNALYPKVPYFTEAGLVAPANLIDAYPSLRLQPSDAVTLEMGWDVLWRQREADAFYRPVPFTPLARTAGQGNRFIGHQMQASLRWQLSPNLEWRAWYVHFDAGPTITRAGGRDVDFLATSLAFRF
jgi:hypothetical protein